MLYEVITMKGGADGSHGDVLVTVYVIVVVIVQVPREPGVVTALKQLLDRLEALRRSFPGRIMDEQKSPASYNFV